MTEIKTGTTTAGVLIKIGASLVQGVDTSTDAIIVMGTDTASIIAPGKNTMETMKGGRSDLMIIGQTQTKATREMRNKNNCSMQT